MERNKLKPKKVAVNSQQAKTQILVVGTHRHARQPSMSLFTNWVAEALSPRADVRVVAAPPFFLNRFTRAKAGAKWLAYLDQYVLLTLQLAVISHGYDLILISDHSNAPSSLLAPRSRLAVMVHDTIAMRQALGQIPDAPRTGLSGRMLQAVIRHAVSRAGLVISNPGGVPSEIRALGLSKTPVPVGCPIDHRRLAHQLSNTVPRQRYVLNVASDGWRTRTNDLIPLWLAVQEREPLALVLAGQTTTATLQRFTEAGVSDVLIMNDVDDLTLAQLYHGCEALITVSHEEGLCIPIMEALSFGKPVFAPDVSPSYVDVFGTLVQRLKGSPENAARSLLIGLKSNVSREETETTLEWFTLVRFSERVRATVLATLETLRNERSRG